MKATVISSLLLAVLSLCSPRPTAPEAVLEKTIAAHDPGNHWPQLNSRFHMSIRRDGQADRHFSIVVNNPEGVFEYAFQQSDSTFSQGMRKADYYYSVDGDANVSDSTKASYQLTDERTLYLREVYEYLFGVPMKLKDPGTTIDPVLQEETFNGQPCWVMKVTYDPSTEGETWYFYINKDTYLLAGYRFYFNESLGDGEFIFIDGYDSVNGLKVAKTKKWYWNKDSAHFRTDELVKVE